MCDIPFDNCPICDTEEKCQKFDVTRKPIKKCKDCEKFAKLWLKLKNARDQCQ